MKWGKGLKKKASGEKQDETKKWWKAHKVTSFILYYKHSPYVSSLFLIHTVMMIIQRNVLLRKCHIIVEAHRSNTYIKNTYHSHTSFSQVIIFPIKHCARHTHSHTHTYTHGEREADILWVRDLLKWTVSGKSTGRFDTALSLFFLLLLLSIFSVCYFSSSHCSTTYSSSTGLQFRLDEE